MISIIIPANNEASTIDRCLQALLASVGSASAEVIVVANACTDNTAERGRFHTESFAKKGWNLSVLDLPEGGKPNALNAGDAAARGSKRLYLDADVIVSPLLLNEINQILSVDTPVYASGKMQISKAHSYITRAYRRIYARLPFVTHGVPGAGLFAVNSSARSRWSNFPQIISDDTFVRLNFTPQERISANAPYDWPLVEGFRALVRVRRRQNLGVAEIRKLYPELLQNDDKIALSVPSILRLFLSDPIGFLVYVSVALSVRFGPHQTSGWERGR